MSQGRRTVVRGTGHMVFLLVETQCLQLAHSGLRYRKCTFLVTDSNTVTEIIN